MAQSGLRAAANLQAEFGLRGVSKTAVDRAINKHEMRKFLESYPQFIVKTAFVKNQDELRGFGEEVGFPIVIKPVIGISSKGVRLVKTAAEVTEINFGIPLLAEEYLDGIEYSVDALSRAGEICIVGVNQEIKDTRKGGNPCLEIGHMFPAPLPSDQTASIVDFVKAFLKIMELDEGPSHTEIKSTRNGLKIIETHPRLGGDYLPELTELATSFDILSATLAWSLGLSIEPQHSTLLSHGSAIRYFTPTPGRLLSISGLDRAKEDPRVTRISFSLRPGDVVAKLNESSDRPGYVIAKGESSRAAMAACDSAISDISIATELSNVQTRNFA
jgi:biotin carboxylase